MKDTGKLGEINPAAKLVVLFFMSLICSMIIMFIGFLAGFIFFDSSLIISIIDGGASLFDEDTITLNKYFQLLSHLGMFILPSLLFALIISGNILKYLKMDVKPELRQLFLGICLIFVSLPLINFLLEINMKLSLPDSLKAVEYWMISTEETAQRITEQFLSVTSTRGLLYNIFLIAVIPAIGEEFIFRGALMRILNQWTKSAHLAVWLSAIIFSAFHMQFFGFLPRLFLGVLFGYMVIYSGTIWIAVIAHFINNAAAVTAYYFYHNNLTDVQLENIGKGDTGTYLTILSVLLVSLLMFAYWKIGKIKENEVFLSG